MRQSMDTLTVKTRGTGLVEITPEVARVLAAARVRDGLVTVYCRHTSASLVGGSSRKEIRCSSTPPRAPTTCLRM
jgi:thiamine phosphate synthase YjbQ (UPF0047 family)